uniref:Uncharacterized protein n=1 Tax=Anopheles atroparvus TaxID=41427 RepID=A0AAG5DHX7_ANOAO
MFDDISAFTVCSPLAMCRQQNSRLKLSDFSPNSLRVVSGPRAFCSEFTQRQQQLHYFAGTAAEMLSPTQLFSRELTETTGHSTKKRGTKKKNDTGLNLISIKYDHQTRWEGEKETKEKTSSLTKRSAKGERSSPVKFAYILASCSSSANLTMFFFF